MPGLWGHKWAWLSFPRHPESPNLPRTLCELLPQPRLKQGHSVVPHSPAMDTAELGPPGGPCPGLGLSCFSGMCLKLSSGTIPELCPWLEWLNGPWLPGPDQMALWGVPTALSPRKIPGPCCVLTAGYCHHHTYPHKTSLPSIFVLTVPKSVCCLWGHVVLLRFIHFSCLSWKAVAVPKCHLGIFLFLLSPNHVVELSGRVLYISDLNRIIKRATQ